MRTLGYDLKFINGRKWIQGRFFFVWIFFGTIYININKGKLFYKKITTIYYCNECLVCLEFQ